MKNSILMIAILCTTFTAFGQPSSLKTESNVVEAASGAILGNSNLTRGENGLNFRIQTSGLQAGHAYSVWWVLSNDDSSWFTVMNAGGSVANTHGEATFAGNLKTGELPATDGKSVIAHVGNGSFDNPFDLNVRLVIRSHGDIIPGQLPAQLTTFNAGCDSNQCYNPQSTFHPAD